MWTISLWIPKTFACHLPWLPASGCWQRWMLSTPHHLENDRETVTAGRSWGCTSSSKPSNGPRRTRRKGTGAGTPGHGHPPGQAPGQGHRRDPGQGHAVGQKPHRVGGGLTLEKATEAEIGPGVVQGQGHHHRLEEDHLPGQGHALPLGRGQGPLCLDDVAVLQHQKPVLRGLSLMNAALPLRHLLLVWACRPYCLTFKSCAWVRPTKGTSSS